jgi:hypothetical protein
LHIGIAMTELITRSGAWLLQQAVTLPDTVIMKQVAVQRGWFETVTGIASGVMTLTILGLTIFLAPAAWSFWRTFRKVRVLLDRVYADVTPLTRHASNVADNLDYITTSIRSDVQQVNATIASANRRLNQAVQLTETRLNEFNALLQVVQQEAEQAFVSTAAAVRGVRTGAATFGGVQDDADEAFLDEGDLDGDDGRNDDDEADEDEIRGREWQSRDNAELASADEPTQPARPRVRSRRRPYE